MATIAHLTQLSSSTDGTTFTTGSFTPTLEDLLFVFVYATGTVDASPTLTSSQGTTFTKVRQDGTTNTLYVFIANELEGGLSQTLTFGCPNDAATGAHITVSAIRGGLRTGSSAVRQSQSATVANGATPTATFTSAALTANATFFAVGNATNTAGINPPTGWTERVDLGYGTPATGFEYATRDSGFTGTTIAGTNASPSAGRITIVEIEVSALTFTLPRTMMKSGGVIGR
jgi:hypothetical protein